MFFILFEFTYLHKYKVICPVCTNNELCVERSTHCITDISTDFYSTLVFTNPK